MSKYKCNKCNKEYTSESWYNIHIDENKCNTTCGRCGEKFSRSDVLSRHLLNDVCVNKPIFKCRRCNMEFHDVSKLNRHYKNKTDCSKRKVKEPTIECIHCHNKFNSQQMLKRHIKYFCDEKDNEPKPDPVNNIIEFDSLPIHEQKQILQEKLNKIKEEETKNLKLIDDFQECIESKITISEYQKYPIPLTTIQIDY
jgi:C2H2-type zinc finger protein/C2H2 type zinc finger protein